MSGTVPFPKDATNPVSEKEKSNLVIFTQSAQFTLPSCSIANELQLTCLDRTRAKPQKMGRSFSDFWQK